jgi:hypothetical protein
VNDAASDKNGQPPARPLSRAAAPHQDERLHAIDPLRLAAPGMHLGIDEPGRTPFTRIPSVAICLASPRGSVSSAPLDAA